MNKKAFGSRVQLIRKNKNMTVDQLSSKIEISVDHLRGIESGRRLPSLPVCVKLINVLNISADELLQGNVKQASGLIVNDLTRKMANLSSDQLNLITAICTPLIEEFNRKSEDIIKMNLKQT